MQSPELDLEATFCFRPSASVPPLFHHHSQYKLPQAALLQVCILNLAVATFIVHSLDALLTSLTSLTSLASSLRSDAAPMRAS